MDRTKAVEIRAHLLRAARAINRAEAIISSLDADDRKSLFDPLWNVVQPLHFQLLQAIYKQHPDLQPPAKGRRFVDTKRRWKEVVLPESVSENDLDAIIFSVVKTQWLKVARVISDAMKAIEARNLPVDADEIIQAVGARVIWLDEAGRLESQGDLRKWRFSEVRLPAG
jgi:hypothetical protein